MTTLPTRRLLPLVAAVALFACGPRYTDQELSDAVHRLRELYYLRDFETGTIEGRAWRDRAPDALEVRAWFVQHLARNDRIPEAIEEAEAMVERDDESPWSWFALAGALNDARALNIGTDRTKEALEPSANAWEMRPDDPDVAWQRATVLRAQAGDSQALGFIAQLPPAMQQHPRLMVAKGEALWYLSYRERNPARKDEAYAVFAEARARDANNLDAYYLAGSFLFRDRRNEEAVPLLDSAATMTTSTTIYNYHWWATQSRRDLTTDEIRDMIAQSAESLLAVRGELPRTLSAISGIFADVGNADRQRELEDRLLELYPDSPEAEWKLVMRARALRNELSEARADSSADTTAIRAEYTKSLQAFVGKEHHLHPGLLGEAYRNLFSQYRNDSTVSDDDLYESVRGMVRYENLNPHIAYAYGPRALAERGAYLKEAAEFAQQGFDAAKAIVDDLRDRGVYDSDGDYERSLDYYNSLMADALGWVYFHGGKLNDAEVELLRAREFNPDNRDALFHLGRLSEKLSEIAGDADTPEARDAAHEFLEDAEQYYMKGALVQQPGPNPNDDALEAMYVQQHGSRAGFETYLASIDDIDRARRRGEVMAERIDAPEKVPPFIFKTLVGDTIAYERLVGRIVVINFWGTWCGPCVVEMPEFQKFADRYDGDPGVVVLTINNDRIVEDLRDWMTKHEYTFRVMLDDGYTTGVGLTAWPTTWFIGPDGRIEFSKRGWSESLDEEFGWRVEAIRGSQ